MANQKITELTALTTASTDDIFPVVDSPASSPVTKKITLSNLNSSLGAIGQIPFPATQNASSNVNTLDDYEEGTWTPAVTFGGAAVSVTYSVQVGQYSKVGNQVAITCRLTLTNNGSSTGNLAITGLPFASANVTNGHVAFTVGFVGGFTGTMPILFRLAPNASAINVAHNMSVDVTDVEAGNTFQIMLGGTYLTAT